MSRLQVMAALCFVSVFCLHLAMSGAHAQNQDGSNTRFEVDAGGDDQLSQREKAEAAIKAFEADDSFQKTRPVYVPPVKEERKREPRREREWSGEGKRGNPISDIFKAFFNTFGTALGWILLLLVAVAIICALIFMLRGQINFTRNKKPEDEIEVSISPSLRLETAAANALLKDADQLAAGGAFAEAVHMLLFRSIDHIQEKQKTGVPRSLTAREIGSLASLPETVRQALRPIIGIVERSFFGGRSVDERDWQSARQAYERFAFGEAWT